VAHRAASLGDAGFRADYGLKYAYLAGAMYKGIASKSSSSLGRARLMGFLGTGGLSLDAIEAAIRHIQGERRSSPVIRTLDVQSRTQPSCLLRKCVRFHNRLWDE
jgi:hypothetical protein